MLNLINFIRSNSFKSILSKILQKFYIVEYHYKTKLDDVPKFTPQSALTFYELDSKLLNQLKNQNEPDLKQRDFQKLTETLQKESTNKCYVVKLNNKIAGYFHIAFEEAYESLVNYKIPNCNDSVYLFKDYTFRKYRGNNVHKFSIYKRLEHSKSLGYKFATVNIIKGKSFSERAYKNFKFKKVFKIVFYNLLLKKITKTIYSDEKRV